MSVKSASSFEPLADPIPYIRDVLGLPIERLSVSRLGGDGAQVRRIGGVPTSFRVSTTIDLDSFLGRLLLWHEIAHVLDDARSDRRSNFNAFSTVGRYSTPSRQLLLTHSDFINTWSRPELIVRIGKVVRPVDDWLVDTSLPDDVRRRLRLKAIEFSIKAKRYQRQDIELFATGFARWIMCPISVAAHSMQLASLFSEVAIKHGLNVSRTAA